MSYIISAGNKKPQWVNEPKAKKTAQLDIVDAAPPVEEENPFFDAVKELPGIKEQVSSLEQAIETATEAVEAVKEVALSEGVIQPKTVGATPVSTPPCDNPPCPPEAAAAPAGEVKVEEKVEEKKDDKPFETAPKPEEKKEEAPKSEEKKDEAPKSEVDEVEIEIPGVKEEKGEVEKEGCGIGCGASSNSKLMAIAKLSPENRKDLSKFWKEDLGMPSEWVESMLKDY